MTLLKLYSKENGCPKCGSKSTEDKYNNLYGVIRRSCDNCGYGWNEKPLDRENDNI